MDFRHAMATFLAELTPQPWDYTDHTGTTLTVIPAGLREEPGRAEVIVRITASHTRAAEIGITTTDMPGLLAALTERTAWEHTTTLDDILAVIPADDGSVVLEVTEVHYSPARREATAYLHVPEAQRMPLASALRRALDVARGWES